MFTPKSKTKAAKNAAKGRSAEDTIHELLKALATLRWFDFERCYDAKSAQGLSYARKCGDFQWFTAKGHGVIEVKETQSTATLPYSNLQSHQTGKLLRRQMAGGLAFVIIHHTKTDTWRQIPIEFFRDRPDSAASWSLSGWEQFGSADMLPIFASMTP